MNDLHILSILRSVNCLQQPLADHLQTSFAQTHCHGDGYQKAKNITIQKPDSPEHRYFQFLSCQHIIPTAILLIKSYKRNTNKLKKIRRIYLTYRHQLNLKLLSTFNMINNFKLGKREVNFIFLQCCHDRQRL